MIEQEQTRRLHGGDLPAELGADRAAGARHQHPPAGDQFAQGRDVDVARRAPEKVLDGDRRQLHRPGHIVEMGEGLGRPHRSQPEPPRVGEKMVDDGFELEALAGDDQAPRLDSPGLERFDNFLEIGEEPENGDALEALADMRALVREEADRLHRIGGVALQPPNQVNRLVARPGDQDRRAINALEGAPLLPLVPVRPVEQSRPEQEEHLHEPVDHRHRARHQQGSA